MMTAALPSMDLWKRRCARLVLTSFIPMNSKASVAAGKKQKNTSSIFFLGYMLSVGAHLQYVLRHWAIGTE